VAARLSAVREVLPGADLRGGDPLLPDATHDHHDVRPGGLFCAVPGARHDGHDHAPAAAAAGAGALLVERWIDVDLPQLRVPSVRAAMGTAAAVVHGVPSDELLLLGVTGTNGKTTVVTLLESVLAAAGRGTGVIGTLGVRLHGTSVPSPRTTPEATDLQRLLRDLRTRGADAVAMEVSSHGLALHRVDGARFAVVGFTNLTQDHLDFHGDMASYLAAKARLFTPALAERGVVAIDAPGAADLVAAARIPVTTVGAAADADLVVRDRHVGADGSSATLMTPDGPVVLRTTLLGAHNLDNAVLAAAMALTAGVPADAVVAGIAAAAAPAGRVEPVPAPPGVAAPRVLVDYAHTPDAVATVVRVGRDLTEGRIAVVLGAGGDRDRAKRPAMGGAAAAADLVVVTDDNPRGEDPAAIRADVLAGARRAEAAAADGRAVEILEVPDRAAAIVVAVGRLDEGDLVLVLGKGHETGQERAGEVLPFDDREAAARALAALATTAVVGP
jgi:UDP-N-acetylmuramoyl-L-alanyl-D-glutamate--2,6-diaminopimelate ligase